MVKSSQSDPLQPVMLPTHLGCHTTHREIPELDVHHSAAPTVVCPNRADRWQNLLLSRFDDLRKLRRRRPRSEHIDDCVDGLCIADASIMAAAVGRREAFAAHAGC
jgi:hypothetical protein